MPALAAAAWAAWQLTPASATRPRRLVTVRQGHTLASVGRSLEGLGLIRSARVFTLYARLRGMDARVMPGRYRISPSLPAPEILRRLNTGFRDDEGVVTIWAGSTVAQIASVLKSAGSIRDADAFEELARRPAGRVRCPFPLPSTGLEGYLAPDTYDFDPGAQPAVVAQAMLDAFVRSFYEPSRGDIARSGRSIHQIVTMAAMVEREAGVQEDRPRIAGVIVNRLQKGMRLQIDATVLYALGRHKTRVMYSDLRTRSPYNTYLHAGLPPGPIANPSLECLEAALHPEEHDYLYYVLGPTPGCHVFAATPEQHQRNVAAYRARRRAREASRSGA